MTSLFGSPRATALNETCFQQPRIRTSLFGSPGANALKLTCYHESRTGPVFPSWLTIEVSRFTEQCSWVSEYPSWIGSGTLKPGRRPSRPNPNLTGGTCQRIALQRARPDCCRSPVLAWTCTSAPSGRSTRLQRARPDCCRSPVLAWT